MADGPGTTTTDTVGSERLSIMSRIAAPMVGGMITAPVLSLFVIPAAHRLMRRRGAGLDVSPSIEWKIDRSYLFHGGVTRAPVLEPVLGAPSGAPVVLLPARDYFFAGAGGVG